MLLMLTPMPGLRQLSDKPWEAFAETADQQSDFLHT